MPITNFIAKIFANIINDIFSDKNIGIISSDVDKYTAISVPKLITLAEYKFVADAEKPHCGITPTIPPNNGPKSTRFFYCLF